jgi:hypothetical protein
MRSHGLQLSAFAVVITVLLDPPQAGAVAPVPPQAARERVAEALDNILTLERPGQDGLATVWDGNKYVQCRRMADRTLRCEAAGVLMQPSLGRVLTPDSVKRLAGLGWRLDSSFGNYVQVFPVKAPTSMIANTILATLADGYGADVAKLEVQSDWIDSEPCPPRNGPSQNLAGVINDAPIMQATAVHACAFVPPPDYTAGAPAASTEALIATYRARVTGEVQRLRINLGKSHIFFVLQTDGGYVQCEPQTEPRAVYCEAVSAESWPVVRAILTPDRLAHLHAAGYADPGRAPNYWKAYPIETSSDAAIARELLAVLHDVYGYDGSAKLEVVTEKDGE